MPTFLLPRSPASRAGSGTLPSRSVGELPVAPHLATVFLTMQDRAVFHKANIGVQAKAWGLALAEESLVRALMAGTSPAEHAERRGVKISTVRSQVRAVLEKSAHSSIRELIRARIE